MRNRARANSTDRPEHEDNETHDEILTNVRTVIHFTSTPCMQ